MSIPLHPEAVPGDPSAIRWVIPPGTLTVRGRVTRAPGEFGALIADGTIVVESEATCLLTRLTSGTWAQEGPRVRSTLVEALARPQEWEAGGASVVGADAALAEAAESVIAGDAGAYVRSHGGQIDLVSAHDGCVAVRLTGACGHCPAATATLHHRIETAIRALHPDLVELRRV